MLNLRSAIAGAPGTRRLSAPGQSRLVEIIRFCAVGGLNWIVDLSIFNLLRILMPLHLVMVAKILAVIAAATFSWAVNRRWTFQTRATTRPTRELVSFLLVNAIGMAPPLLLLWVSHYLLGWTSAMADNISANVIGLILGTFLRYFGYRHLVFTNQT